MGLFRRSKDDDTEPPVQAFWRWWAESGHTVSPHAEGQLTDELTRRVQAISPELTWHFGPGTRAQHRLTVTAGGVAEARPAAARWHRAAPANDPTWEFAPSQEADPATLSNQLQIGGHVFDLAATRFHVEEVPDELRIHVGVFHPEFANAPDALRMQIAFLVLDWLVGEDDVERWIGHVEPVVDDAASHLEASGLSEAIGRIASLRDPDGWATLTGEGPDGAVMAVFRHGVRWIDHPLLDLHHEVVTAFQPEANGFPDEATLEHLLTLEDDLNSTLGSSTLLVGHVTSAGTRVFHVYSDSEDQNAADGIARWCTDHDLPVSTSLDPAWRDVRPFIG